MRQITEEMDAKDRHVGSGWISGMLSIVLATIGLSTTLCLLYPQFFTVADIRGYYNVGLIRFALQLVLVVAFGFGVFSVALRRSKVLGFVGMTMVLAATLMGGSRATQRLEVASDIYLGLDFFLLNFILLGVIFIPIERLCKKRDQPIFRDDWREDLFYFFFSSLFVQVLAYLSLTPSMTWLGQTAWAGGLRELVASQPLVLQFFEIMFLVDLVQYFFHRAFHEVPFLWRFHSVHHSAKQLDWIAGSRMHLFEMVLLRSVTTLPMYLIGFAEPVLYAYIFVVYLVSTFVHSNIRYQFGWLQYVMVTPRFHHWHHGIDDEAMDINYSVHFPFIDRIFGTYHMPGDSWPDGYGVQGHPVPRGYLKQFMYPFRKRSGSQSPID